MSENQNHNQVDPQCPIVATEQIPLNDTPVALTELDRTPIVKVPAVLAETTLQIVVEADISLSPSATEIKRVHKHAFLNQVKLVPVEFEQIGSNGYDCNGSTDFFNVTRAKLFVSGF